MIAAEAAGTQEQLVDQIINAYDLANDPSGYRPQVLHLRYPAGVSKSDRISSLAWRFEKHRVRIPNDRPDSPAYKDLWQQIKLFSLEGRPLPYDDALDTLSMGLFVGRPRSRWSNMPGGEGPLDPIEEMKEGRTNDPKTGMPYGSMVEPHLIPRHALLKHALDLQEREDPIQWENTIE